MILEKLFAPATEEQRATGGFLNWNFPLSPFGGTSKAGLTVSARDAVSYSPVWAALDLISGDVAKIPIRTMRRDSRGVNPATDHPVNALLSKYTGEMPAMLWVSSMMSNAMLYGNGWSRIIRDARGRAEELRFIPSTLVSVERLQGSVNSKRVIIRNDEGNEISVSEADMFQLPGLVFSNLGGVPLIQFALNTIGRLLSAEGYADDFFANSAVPSGWLMHPAHMSPEAQERFLQSIQSRHAGAGNRHRLGILEEGMQWQSSGIPPEDAMLIEMLNLGVKDVARFFKLPPHKLGDEGRTSFNSVAEENRQYVSSTLGSWLSKFESEANCKLFPDNEWNTYFVSFDTDRIFQPPYKERMEGNAIAIMNGIRSRNEVREEEGWNPYEGGDEFLTPLNLSPADQAEEEPPAAEPPEPNEEDMRASAAAILSASCKRAVRRICNQTANSVKQKPEAILSIVTQLDPALREHALLDTRDPMLLLHSICPDSKWNNRRLWDVLIAEVTDTLIEVADQPTHWRYKRCRDAIPGLEEICDHLVASIFEGTPDHEHIHTTG